MQTMLPAVGCLVEMWTNRVCCQLKAKKKHRRTIAVGRQTGCTPRHVVLHRVAAPTANEKKTVARRRQGAKRKPHRVTARQQSVWYKTLHCKHREMLGGGSFFCGSACVCVVVVHVRS